MSLVGRIQCVHVGAVLHVNCHGKEPRNCQQTAAQQIAQCCQIWYGRIVRIDLPLPHSVHNDVRNVQQQHDLQEILIEVNP